MRREKLLPLTETAYYILLALLEPAHGYAVMQKIEALSEGQVRIAAGTLTGFREPGRKRLIGPVKGRPRRKITKLPAREEES